MHQSAHDVVQAYHRKGMDVRIYYDSTGGEHYYEAERKELSRLTELIFALGAGGVVGAFIVEFMHHWITG